MKDKKSKIDIYTTIYGIDLVVVLNPKYKEVNKLYSYEDKDLDEAITTGLATTCRARDRKTDKPIVLVCINKYNNGELYNKLSDSINTYAHEATHVWMNIADYIGHAPDTSNSEVDSYHIGYFTECIYKTAE